MTTTRGTETGPTGKTKNCNTWAEYEVSGQSEFSNLCNGGWFDEDRWEVCGSRVDCRRHTYTRPASPEPPPVPRRRHLSIHDQRVRVNSPPTTHQRREQRETYDDKVEVHEPPEDALPYMGSPRIVHQGGGGGHMSPTFLPEEGESFLERFFKNGAQGALSAFLWHGYDLTRNVNMFPHEKERPRRRKKKK